MKFWSRRKNNPLTTISSKGQAYLDLRFAIVNYGIEAGRKDLLAVLAFYANEFGNNTSAMSRTLDALIEQKEDTP